VDPIPAALRSVGCLTEVLKKQKKTTRDRKNMLVSVIHIRMGGAKRNPSILFRSRDPERAEMKIRTFE
jgi:hypothetical protein